MASYEAPSFGSFHCLECGNQVEIVHGDKKLSFGLHQLTHNNFNAKSQEVNRSSSDLFGKSNSSSTTVAPYTCEICNELVEILYNDVKLSLEIHSKKHSTEPAILSDDQLSNSSSTTSKNSSKKSIKVKNKQKVVLDSTIIDDAFITLAPCFRAHRGFILKNSDGVIFCNICKIDVDIFSISEHIKAKCHEDNAITLLKSFIPDNLHSSLDRLAFNRSNLICNLCDCKIDLCSNNPHETIVNIFVHNAQNNHVSKKNSANSGFNDKSDDPHRMLQTLSEISPVISENRCYLDIKFQLQLVCRLCNQSFDNDKDESALLDSLNSHFIAKDHVKYQNAVSALKSFESSNTSLKEDHMLIVSKEYIYCKRCFVDIPSDTKSIEEHVKSCPAMRINKNDPFLKQVEEILINIPSLVRTQGAVLQKTQKKRGNAVQEEPNVVCGEPIVGDKIATVKEVENEIDNSGDVTANNPVDIKILLSSLSPQFHDVEYIIVDDDGKFLKCLICDCRIPPAHNNVETHLNGRNHRINEDKMKTGSNVFGDAAAAAPTFVQSENQTLVDQVFQHLTRSDPLVKANEIILMNLHDELHYFCTACGDFIRTSTDADTFKASIYKHVQLETHLRRFPNQRKLIGPKELPKDMHVKTIGELFAGLPKDLQEDRKFIKPDRDQVNTLYCSLCKVKVPIRLNNLQQHLEGACHSDNLPKGFLSKAVGYAVSVIKDAIFHKIKMSDTLIMDNEKHLSRRGEDYFCGLCSATIQSCNDLEELTERFLNHLEGNKHILNVVKMLIDSNPGIRDEKSYVKVKNQTVHCKKCNVALPPAYEESNLKKHVFAHFSGKRHNTSTIPSQIPSSSTSEPYSLPKMPDYSSMFNQPTASDKPMPPLHQSHVGVSNSWTTAPRPLIGENTPVTVNPVYEAFRNIPSNLQIDMKYIKPGTIPDYLTCTLCSTTINPFYLKDHLIEETHLKEKRIFEERVAHWKQRVM